MPPPRDILADLPAREGHFLLESGYHTNLWLTLDALFVDAAKVAPLIAALADKLRSHGAVGICGPLVGGAFLAQALAGAMGLAFYYTEPARNTELAGPGLFQAAYRLPPAVGPLVRGAPLAVVDDVISAGSSVRATVAALSAAGARTVVVGSLLVLGDAGLTHFAGLGIPVETLGRCAFSLWQPAECPLCRARIPLE